MRITVVGTGHVGLTTCVSLAAIGHQVVGTDLDGEKITMLQQGASPFFEPGIEELLNDQMTNGNLHFTTAGAEAIGAAEVVFICVGTPPRATGEASLIAVESAARTIALHAIGRTVVVEKSTVPTGTAQRVRRTLSQERRDLHGDIEVVSNPEFLREGLALHDSMHPDRILIGAESEWALEAMRRVYEPLTAEGIELIETDIATAELAKHACNAFLALKISYVNALAQICEKADADVNAVVEVMGTDPRIGRPFLNAGLGYGGSCFPKDLQAFQRLSERLGYNFPLLGEVARINRDSVRAVRNKIEDALWNLEGKRVALLGLAFKPGTDDTRDAPALELARMLIEDGVTVVGYDPQAMTAAKAEVPELETAPDAYEAAAGSECLVICTEWGEFKSLDLVRIKNAMRYPVIVDGRNIFDPDEMNAYGFAYYPTGRKMVR